MEVFLTFIAYCIAIIVCFWVFLLMLANSSGLYIGVGIFALLVLIIKLKND